MNGIKQSERRRNHALVNFCDLLCTLAIGNGHLLHLGGPFAHFASHRNRGSLDQGDSGPQSNLSRYGLEAEVNRDQDDADFGISPWRAKTSPEAECQ